MPSRSSKPKSASISDEVADDLRAAIDSFNNPTLNGGIRGRFCYVLHRGDPICRLGYRPVEDVWDFALYRYSTNSYSNAGSLMPNKAPLTECIRIALSTYNLL